jgi:hypothetical protein
MMAFWARKMCHRKQFHHLHLLVRWDFTDATGRIGLAGCASVKRSQSLKLDGTH